MKKQALSIEWRYDIPIECMKLAHRRTGEMVTHFGRNIRAMHIETLAASCYLQGVEDSFYYYEHQSKTLGGEDVIRVALASGILGLANIQSGL